MIAVSFYYFARMQKLMIFDQREVVLSETLKSFALKVATAK